MAEAAGDRSVRTSSVATALGLLALGTIHFSLAFDTLRRKTPTVDEVAHLPAGISYLQKNTFKMYRLSPPLARAVPALAALPVEPKMPYQLKTWTEHDPSSHWLFAFGFLAVNGSDPDRYLECFTRARTVIAVWSALTIPFLFWWGNWWFGRWAGWFAALLWTFSPNILAHAGMVTTDLPATSLGLIASLFFARWLDRATWRRAFVAGAWLGLAQLVKFSSLWLYVIWPTWAILRSFAPGEPGTAGVRAETRGSTRWPRFGWKKGGQSLAILCISFFVIDVGYRFEGVFTPMDRFHFISRMLTRPRLPGDGPPHVGSNGGNNKVHQRRVNRFRGSVLGLLPCPLPYHYVAGFDEQKFEADGMYQMYLRGEFANATALEGAANPTGRRGWWYYYVYALAIKVPLSTWWLAAMALFALFRWPRATAGASVWPLVLLSAAPLLAMSLLTDINLGLRYVLPIFPFLFLLAGSAVGPDRPRWWNALAALAICWNVGAIARIHPHELAYFNELVGGPSNGRFHLIDSNIDWGQDLRGLSRWLDEHPEWRDVRLAYMGTVPPEFEGISDYGLAPRDLRFVDAALHLPGEDPDDP